MIYNIIEVCGSHPTLLISAHLSSTNLPDRAVCLDERARLALALVPLSVEFVAIGPREYSFAILKVVSPVAHI